ncbi:MAG TPA: CDP-alcohol phosphatidyltransferase family protein [Kofleriaceae bacterium]|nr:CDP-alcohol phosphatidyltransferase family protein [Kofleriaceae bacterium]
MVRDVYFTYFLAGLCALAGVAYAVRVAMRGVARSERVGRIGGTMMVGQEIMDWTYWSVEPIVRGLVAMGVTANGLTWSALVLGLGAGVALGFDMFGLAALLATCSTIGDILDGQVARLTKTGSMRGELLDAAIDRYTEFAFLAGLAFHYRESPAELGLVLAALLACFMVSYASAKAEALQVEPPRGLMRRHERAVYLITGVAFASLFGLPILVTAALAIVAVVGNVAAILRLVRIGRALR